MATATTPRKIETPSKPAAPAANSGKPAGRTFEKRPKVALWKPNKEGKGNAAIFEYSGEKASVFVTMMPQVPGEQRRFDQAKKVNLKLGPSDIGEILAVLNGRIEGIGRKNDAGFWSGLHHESPSGVTKISLSKGDYGLVFRVASERGEVKTANSVGISTGEAEQLKVFLSQCLWLMQSAGANDQVPPERTPDSGSGGNAPNPDDQVDF